MTKRDKLVARFLGRPRDFTWDELVALLRGFGYEASRGGKTGGSRVRFTHATAPAINVHRRIQRRS